MNTTRIPLSPGQFYHIYNRGNNGETLFREERNYRYFLTLYAQYIEPVADTFAYCLLRNHFHFFIRIKDHQEHGSSEPRSLVSLDPSKQFARLFGTYTKAFNKAYQRNGRLFSDRFQRKPVTNYAYFVTLIAYIHRNPQKHNFVNDFRDWPYSSYNAIVRNAVPVGNRIPTHIQWQTVITWFDGPEPFLETHQYAVNESLIVDVLEK
ncbi:MAG: hypothetical protein KC415_08330 [Anaerolineales bacterium]|nr:hypothetical protein [Anaerolineales bacterium]